MNNKIDIFSEPELIDNLIKTRLSAFPRKGGQGNTRLISWTDEEIELRNAVIYDYIAKQACSREETARRISKRWDISIQNARKYIKMALEDFAANWEQEEKDKLRKRYIDRIEKIMNDSIQRNDRKAALKCQDMINKLNGLYEETNKIEIEGNVPLTFNFS